MESGASLFLEKIMAYVCIGMLLHSVCKKKNIIIFPPEIFERKINTLTINIYLPAPISKIVRQITSSKKCFKDGLSRQIIGSKYFFKDSLSRQVIGNTYF